MSSKRAINHQGIVWNDQQFKHSHRRYAKYHLTRSYHSRTRWRQLLRGCHMGIFDFCHLIDDRIKSVPRGKWSDDNE